MFSSRPSGKRPGKTHWLARWHKWPGLLLGPVWLAIAASGLLNLWFEELDTLGHPEFHGRPAGVADFARLDAAWEKILQQFPDSKALTVYFLPASEGAWRIRSTPRNAAQPVVEWLVSPEDGEVIARRSPELWEAANFAQLNRQFHANLWSGDTGKVIMGISGIFMITLIGTGIWRYANSRSPSGPSPVARRLRWHRRAGLAAVVPVCLLSLSGIVICFFLPLQQLARNHLPSTEFAGRLNAGKVTEAPGPRLPPSALLKAAQGRFPQADIRRIQVPASASSPVMILLKQPGEFAPRGSTRLWLHPQTGKAVHELDPKDGSILDAVFEGMFPIHTGEALGSLGNIINHLGALLLMWLAWSGMRLGLKWK